jgi:hypothetical protein
MTEKLYPYRLAESVKAKGIHQLILLKKINLVKQQNSDSFIVTPVGFAKAE